MNILQELLEAAQFTKYGKHKGVLTRTITKAEIEAAKKREQERNKKRYAKTKEFKLEELRTEKIPHLDTKEIEDIMSSGPMGGIGGEIEDISEIRPGYKVIDGVEVASVRMRLSLIIDLEDMYDQETIDKMYNGQKKIDDSLNITIYRDPKDPKKFRGGF